MTSTPIERHPMKVEEMLLIMEQNLDHYPDYAKMSDEQKKYLANLNVLTGTSESFFLNGRIVAVGGVRYTGLGEAWMITPPATRELSCALLRNTKLNLKRIIEEKNLWRVFATSQISENFLQHCGFVKEPAHIWTRELWK